MNDVLIIGGMAAVTLLIRYPILAVISRVRLPDSAIKALRFVPVAVLTAIIVPEMLAPADRIDLALSNAYLYAGILAAVIAWRTRNLLATIVIGMAIFLLWRAVFGA